MEPLDGPPLRTRLDPTRLQGQRHLDPVDVRQRALEQHLMGSTPGLEPEDAVRGAPQSLRRLPVYEETLDNIIGILYAKDLLPDVVASHGGELAQRGASDEGALLITA